MSIIIFMMLATDHLSKRGVEMEVLLIRGEGIFFEAEFGELAPFLFKFILFYF